MQFQKITTIKPKPTLMKKYSNIDVATALTQTKDKHINLFFKIITNNILEENLINFYNNIESLEIIKINNGLLTDFFNKRLEKYHLTFLKNSILKTIIYFLDLLYPVGGVYNIEENKINVLNENYSEVIYHELFHMSSSIIQNEVLYSGFNQIFISDSQMYDIGKGLNEGYTQLLTERYFKDYNILHAYTIEVFFAFQLERIIGKEKMENLYFQNDLQGLINELKQYAKEELILKFIADLDDLNEIIHTPSLISTEKEKKIINNKFRFISIFLISCYVEKLQLIEENCSFGWEIRNKQELISNYINSFFIEKTIKGTKYQFLPENTFTSYKSNHIKQKIIK